MRSLDLGEEKAVELSKIIQLQIEKRSAPARQGRSGIAELGPIHRALVELGFQTVVHRLGRAAERHAVEALQPGFGMAAQAVCVES
ncbi:hypothetical protein LB553_10590 [Mesorhizobium sp. CA8]|nr:hypothetical protein [Mesorhizobium sp. CA8]